jgi:hypothetical protein
MVWGKARLAFYLLTAVLTAASDSRATDVEWWAGSLVLLVSLLSILMLVGMQAANPMSAPVWQRPSWQANPFNLGQPLRFFHFGGWWFVAGGCGMLASSVRYGSPVWSEAGLVLGAGIGMLLGIRLCERVFKSKVQPDPARVPRGGPTRG